MARNEPNRSPTALTLARCSQLFAPVRPDKHSLADLGVYRQRVAEWRQTRDAGELVVDRAISGALAED